jgi:hypothetical protein
VSRDFALAGTGVGVDALLELPDSFSLMPLIRDVWDREKVE